MRKNLLTFTILIFVLLKGSAQCLLYPVPLNQRISNSALVIEGKVTNSVSFWNAAHTKIFTSHLIDVYKTFKGTSSSFIEVITEGGIVGNKKHVFEPSLTLKQGDIGIFTLNAVAVASQFGKPVYEPYAGPQGFVKYDVSQNTAYEPFDTYTHISTTLYTNLSLLTGSAFLQVKPIDPFQSLTTGITVMSTAAVTAFTPTLITAGTFSVLTITGTAFGTSTGTVSFRNADNGGSTFTDADPSEIVSWTNTQIQVKVPTDAGTGVIRVNGVNSSQTLTVSYSHLNLNSSGTVYNTKHIAQSGGGYVWTYNTAFAANAPAKASFERSLGSWRCNTYINWTLASGTSSITASANDGVNIVTFNSGLSAGILGQCGSYWSGCGSSPNMNWIVQELDIEFANSPGSLTWQFGPASATTSEYDFESVTVHELGHGHQLGHVINSNDLMHYALSNGQNKRTILSDDLNGGLAVMSRNTTAGSTCGQPLMTPLSATNCALNSVNANFTANKTVICPGQNSVFTDLSSGGPTAWSWSFPGGTPSTSSVQNPTVTYNTSGNYYVSLTASKSGSSHTYSISSYIKVSGAMSLPFSENFQGSTFVPANWYLVDAGSDNDTWSKSLSAGAQGTSYSAYFDNFNVDATGTRDELKTFVNLSGYANAKMTFYRAYKQTFPSPNIDSLEIRVSTNCGTSSTQAYYKGGSQIASGGTGGSTTAVFVPASSQWAKDSIDLTAYTGQSNVMVSIINRGNFGNALYIDQINFTGSAAVTTPTATINSVTVGCTGKAIALTDASSGVPTSWNWSMIGGTPSTASTQNTSVTYATAGVKTISLTATNSGGSHTVTKTLTITATPVLTVTPNTLTLCSGSSYTLNASGATTYSWLPAGSGPANVISPSATTIYSVTGTQNNCVSASLTATVTVVVCTGINTLSYFPVIVSPNPGTGLFTISSPLDLAGSEVTITNSFGQLIKEEPVQAMPLLIDLSSFAKGIYYLHLRSKNGTGAVKLILE